MTKHARHISLHSPCWCVTDGGKVLTDDDGNPLIGLRRACATEEATRRNAGAKQIWLSTNHIRISEAEEHCRTWKQRRAVIQRSIEARRDHLWNLDHKDARAAGDLLQQLLDILPQ